MFVAPSVSTGNRQSLSNFYRALHRRQSVNRGSPNVTKNLSMAGFEVITYGRF